MTFPTTTGTDTAARARAMVDGYFDALEAADFDRAVTYFTDDVCYSHPPYPEEPAGSPRYEVQGQNALRALFERRGARSSAHRIDTFLVADDQVMFGGVVFDGAGETALSFVSTGRLDPDTARLREYAAYVSMPPVWSALEAATDT